jgi:RNA polymerase sigma-70 factor (ECF subfamily)
VSVVDVREAITQAHHEEWARVIAALTRRKSRTAYDKAIELAGNTAETAYLTRRRDQLG